MKNQFAIKIIFGIMIHIGAYLLCIVSAKVTLHHFFTIHHFPVSGKHEVVADIVYQWYDGTSFAECRNTAALETITTVNDKGIARDCLCAMY